MTEERINALKERGLTGVTFSLDHHDPIAHDRFRGRPGLHQQVVASARIAVDRGLVTELALCATNDFISEENLAAYGRLAAELGVTFIQIVEPKPIGKLAGRAVAPRPEKRAMLEAFHDRVRNAEDGPLLHYVDRHNRTHGCEGGKFHIYVGASGRAFPCPFCPSVSAALEELTPTNLNRVLFCPNAAAH